MFKLIDRAVESTLVALLLAMVVVGGLQVFNRFALNMSLSWSEELQRYAHIWLVFLAVPVAYRRCAHIGMDMLVERFAPPVQRALRLACELLWLGFGLCVAYYAMVIMGVARNQTSSGLGITMDCRAVAFRRSWSSSPKPSSDICAAASVMRRSFRA